MGQTDSSIETYTLPYVTHIANGKLPDNPGSSIHPLLCDNLEGQDGVQDGESLTREGHMGTDGGSALLAETNATL